MILLDSLILDKTMQYYLIVLLWILIFGLFLIIVGITFFAFMRVWPQIKDKRMRTKPKPNNYVNVLLSMLAVAVGVVFIIKSGLENNVGMLNYFLFSIFPYVAVAIFLIGFIYRYKNRGFQVSSLSSEFLERKKLFWGSQPFHWGLMVLFFGHLIAFLFPRAVLAWNGEPVRLLILEITSFVFGVSALVGLGLLIKRRLQSKMVLASTNKMDMLVYTVLIVQLVSGLGVAYFERWGSSWFAGVLTPYLRSIFAFNPDIGAVSAMPWIIQIHIFSAFFIIAIIPFTRFMHFLVAPVDYLFRKYQLVIWNWNKDKIRTSTNYFYGRKPEN